MTKALFLFLFLCTRLHVQSGEGLSVVLDGKIDENEWQNAKTYRLHRGGEVKIMKDARYIYVAVHGDGSGWSHVYAKRGTSIYVLHASAALGASVYISDTNKTWRATQSFKWELRDRTMRESAIKDRRTHLEKNGWVATVSGMHPTDQEFVISRSLFDSTKMRIAVIRTTDPKSPHYWPPTLNDDVLAEKLVYGATPDVLKFNFESWGTID